MTNKINNVVTIIRKKEKVNEFISNFREKVFESYIPIPEILKKYDTESSF